MQTQLRPFTEIEKIIIAYHQTSAQMRLQELLNSYERQAQQTTKPPEPEDATSLTFLNEMKQVIIEAFLGDHSFMVLDIEPENDNTLFWQNLKAKRAFSLHPNALVQQERQDWHSQKHLFLKQDLAIQLVKSGGDLIASTVQRRTPEQQKLISSVNKFRLITCFSTVSRFFQCEQYAKQFFLNIANLLEAEHGYCILFFRSGTDLVKQQQRREDDATPNNKKPRYECFGSQITNCWTFDMDAPMKSVIQNMSYAPQPTTEYLVFCNVVQTLAANGGLSICTKYPTKLGVYFASQDCEKPFKHFDLLGQTSLSMYSSHVVAVLKKNKITTTV